MLIRAYYWSPLISPKHNISPSVSEPVPTLWYPEGGDGFNIQVSKSETLRALVMELMSTNKANYLNILYSILFILYFISSV